MQQAPQQKSKNGPADTGKKSKKKQVRAEAAKSTIMQENELLSQELDSARKQIEDLQKQLEDQELKSKTDVQLLVKEVEYLRSSQTELKQELSTLMKEKLEKEKVKSEGSFVKAYMEPEMAVVESREWVSSRGYDGISTSPPYWDTDDDDEHCGLRPSQLYVKYTWKIDKFSQINQRELRSDVFEVGGYKWYILMYPQGCDVSNHLSVFLCVANHDKLLPGWNHYAQFTVAVVNKDPKRSKYSDTLHRFWKKEHDWGWKKFMLLSNVMDGFVTADTLIIKAQVQVIREKADRPFRCLDCQYRRELVRVYLTNVEQICRRFVEEKKNRLVKWIHDKARWSSICAFWLALDPKSKRIMTKERTNTILRAVVKHFFIEKEVTSALVMDSLYSGLRALQDQIKSKNGESPFPVVRLDQNMFILIDDVLLLLERVSLEPLPPKEDKGPQNRMKDGGPGDEFSQESVERDERRLTELGRRVIEIFVLAHIFGKIECAYQEVVKLEREEELISEEGKQKRNNHKGVDDKTIASTLNKLQVGSLNESKGSM